MVHSSCNKVPGDLRQHETNDKHKSTLTVHYFFILGSICVAKF